MFNATGYYSPELITVNVLLTEIPLGKHFPCQFLSWQWKCSVTLPLPQPTLLMVLRPKQERETKINMLREALVSSAQRYDFYLMCIFSCCHTVCC